MAFFQRSPGLRRGHSVPSHWISIGHSFFQGRVLCSLVPPHLRKSGPQLWFCLILALVLRTRDPPPGLHPTQDILRFLRMLATECIPATYCHYCWDTINANVPLHSTDLGDLVVPAWPLPRRFVFLSPHNSMPTEHSMFVRLCSQVLLVRKQQMTQTPANTARFRDSARQSE